MEYTPEHKSRDEAARDLTDIAALKKYEPFNSYFLRRLRMKQTDAERKALYDRNLTAQEREEERLRAQTLDEILRMMSVDEGIARGIVERQP